MMQRRGLLPSFVMPLIHRCRGAQREILSQAESQLCSSPGGAPAKPASKRYRPSVDQVADLYEDIRSAIHAFAAQWTAASHEQRQIRPRSPDKWARTAADEATHAMDALVLPRTWPAELDVEGKFNSFAPFFPLPSTTATGRVPSPLAKCLHGDTLIPAAPCELVGRTACATKRSRELAGACIPSVHKQARFEGSPVHILEE